MESLLQRDADNRWQLEGIEFAIKERVGKPEQFIGRVVELEFLYGWANRVQDLLSKSIAFLGRRKVGKSLILERLYNILYSEHKGLIPFYYEFTEGERDGKEFYRDFVSRFYMQVIGYYTRDKSWNRKAVNKDTEVSVEHLMAEIETLIFPNKKIVLSRLQNSSRILQTNRPPYEYVIAAVGAAAGFATTVGIEDKVVQMVDEFQYLNMYIDAGVVDTPCMAYMSTAENKVAPLIITGSLMGVMVEELTRWLPHRFSMTPVPKMNPQEAIMMTLNYGPLYGHSITPEIAEYIVYTTNGVPGRIMELLSAKMGKPTIATIDDVDAALEYEVGVYGTIKHDWDEYLELAMEKVNHVNMRRITYFLCKTEGTWYFPKQLKEALELDIEDKKLRQELELLFKYDIVQIDSGRYGGVFDRTLKKVLMKNYGDVLGLPMEEFTAYFKNDNMLDYLRERVEQLELDLAAARELRTKLEKLRGEHNNLKGHYYEREILLRLMKGIIDDEGGLVAGISVTAFDDYLNYHLETGEEIDIVLAGESVVIMAECKNYDPDRLDAITQQMVTEFMAKAKRLHQARFGDKELRLAFFSKHGFQPTMADYLREQGIGFG